MNITRFQYLRWMTPEDRDDLVGAGVHVELVDGYPSKEPQRESPLQWRAMLSRLDEL